MTEPGDVVFGPSDCIRVLNAGCDLTQDDLRGLFLPFGGVSRVVMSRFRRQAVVRMENVAAATSAIQHFDLQPAGAGRILRVRYSSQQELTAMVRSTFWETTIAMLVIVIIVIGVGLLIGFFAGDHPY
ncbi:uncharacterized protein LOC113287757 [Papaver somniferum]|uniref:uncharacterized protein LOC113287757 n=1 Tax=Papaver somniferum TaxID=3469 RepID=UPI000E705C88|nr:uncharacterized protein LOC113287757 [Papaver somniferum]